MRDLGPVYMEVGDPTSQEKLKTMLMQNLGVTNKEHYVMLWYFWSGQYFYTCIFIFVSSFRNLDYSDCV